MDMNACDVYYVALRNDCRWGICNDYTGEGRHSGKGYGMRAEAEAECDRLNSNPRR